MTDSILAALIASGVSLIGVLVSFFTTWLTNNASRKRLFREIDGRFSQFLYQERLASFAEAFEIIGRLKRFKSPQYLTKYEEVQQIYEDLLNWSSGKGGLLMSASSIQVHRALCSALKKQPANGESYSYEQAEKIWELRSNFKQMLRSDVLYLTPNSREKRKKRSE